MSVPTGKFFLSLQPDTEALALQELKNWTLNLQVTDIQQCHGGIEFEAPLNVGFSLNTVLKIPHRILLRIETFKCNEFKALENKLTRIRWGDYIGTGKVQFKVASQSSRLYHKKRIEELALKSFKIYREGQPASKKDSDHDQLFFIKFNENICTVSVDTSGEHLHKRGYKKLSTEAPLRENIAASLIFNFINETQIDPSNYHLVDPFCGSGTLLGESHFLCKPLSGFREYSYQHFRIQRKLLEVVSPSCLQEYEFKSYNGFDLSPKAVAAAKENLTSLPNINIKIVDAFDYSKAPHPCVVITNPPYGARLEGIDLKKALKFMDKNYAPDFMGIYTAKSQGQPAVSGLTLLNQYSLKNTSIPANLLIYKKTR